MARSVNKVFLIGNVGQEPEVRTTASGTKVARVSLATSRAWKDRNGAKQEKTEWHRVTFWDRTAEIVEQFVHKGDRLYVEGRLEYSQTEQDGQTRYWTEIVAQELVLLGGGGERDTAGSAQRAPAKAAPSPFDDDDDLPF